VALRFLGANGQTGPVGLLIKFLRDKNKSVFINHDKLRREAAKYPWTLHDLRLIAADWFQGKDEDKLLRLAKAVRQNHARYAVGTHPHISINGEPITISWEIQASILQAWEESAAEESSFPPTQVFSRVSQFPMTSPRAEMGSTWPISFPEIVRGY
jgi:hypothetical protein